MSIKVFSVCIVNESSDYIDEETKMETTRDWYGNFIKDYNLSIIEAF
jgi:hypothetical protein